jgi:hypothetical protein
VKILVLESQNLDLWEEFIIQLLVSNRKSKINKNNLKLEQIDVSGAGNPYFRCFKQLDGVNFKIFDNLNIIIESNKIENFSPSMLI